MTNNFLQFSEMVECAPEQASWLVTRLEELSDACEFKKESKGVWLHAEESFNPELVAQAICEFQEHFGIKKAWSATWAATCSRPLIGEFGGGAIVCCRGKAYLMDAGMWAWKKAQRLESRRRRPAPSRRQA